MTNLRLSGIALFAALPFISCQNGARPTIHRVRDGQALSSYRLKSMAGARDGDRLRAQVVFVANDSSLRMDLRFRIGVPTRLESGRYRWDQGNQTTQGNVAATSVTFLGGQNGPPSLGGVFELQSSEVSLYEIRLPTRELASAASFAGDPDTPPPPFGERRGE